MHKTAEEILAFVGEFISEHRYSPTYDEILQGTTLTSKSHLKYWIDALIDDGLIERQDRVMRGITKVVLPHKTVVTSLSPSLAPRKRRKKYHRKPIDDLVCIYCGATNVPIDNDHFWPKILEGVDTHYNKVPACNKCNTRKSGKEPVGWILETFDRNTLSRVLCYLLTPHNQ